MQRSIESRWRIVRLASESNLSVLNGSVLKEMRAFKSHRDKTAISLRRLTKALSDARDGLVN